MQFFLAQVEQGKDIVCAYLRASAVNYLSPDDFFAVEGFGQIKILAFGQVPAALS
jgi:hypothetical protein